MIGDRRVLCLLLPVFGKERAGLGPIHGWSGATGSEGSRDPKTMDL